MRTVRRHLDGTKRPPIDTPHRRTDTECPSTDTPHRRTDTEVPHNRHHASLNRHGGVPQPTPFAGKVANYPPTTTPRRWRARRCVSVAMKRAIRLSSCASRRRRRRPFWSASSWLSHRDARAASLSRTRQHRLSHIGTELQLRVANAFANTQCAHRRAANPQAVFGSHRTSTDQLRCERSGGSWGTNCAHSHCGEVPDPCTDMACRCADNEVWSEIAGCVVSEECDLCAGG